MIAKQLITGHVVPLKTSDTGAFALAQMEDARLSHLPIVEASLLLGVISDKDIQLADNPDLGVGTYQTLPTAAFIGVEQPLYEVLKLIATLKLTMLPVVNDQHHYLGAIVLPSVVQALAEMVGVTDPGGIIVLEINDKDYSLAEIVQIVESNDAKILSCFVTSRIDSNLLEITLKINRVEIGPLLQAFFRLNYQVTASWSQEDSYNENLQDRFNALMNYLNI
jgi:predicted transcriptional regulator